MDQRRELGLINKHVRRRNRESGEQLIWFEYSPISGGYSSYDDVYDEGVPGSGGRVYKSGVVVPTVYVSEQEDAFRAIPDGRQTTQNIKATVLYRDIVAAGLDSPDEYEQHLNDVFHYDGLYYKVNEYVVRGRLGEEVMVLISGFQMYLDQEMPFDIGPQNPRLSDLPWPTSLPS